MANEILNEVTAVLSIRVPYRLKQYITDKAIGMNINPTTYACHILSKAIEQPEADNLEIEQLRAALLEQSEYAQQYEKLAADNLEIAKKTAADLTKSIEEKKKLQEEIVELNKAVELVLNTGSDETDKLEKELNKLKSEISKMKGANEGLSKVVDITKTEKENQRKQLAAIAESLWNKIHKEEGKVPKYIDDELKKISRY